MEGKEGVDEGGERKGRGEGGKGREEGGERRVRWVGGRDRHTEVEDIIHHVILVTILLESVAIRYCAEWSRVIRI